MKEQPFQVKPKELETLDLNDLLRICLHTDDQGLWAEFIRRSQPLIARVIIKRAGRSIGRMTASSVDDLVQDTYLKLCANNFKALREFECDHENALYGFLKVVASHVVQDHFRGSYSQKRGRGKEQVCLDQVSATHGETSSTMAHLERELLILEIKRFLATGATKTSFSRDRAIFWLYYGRGLTCRAIAQKTCIGLTVKGVESTLFRLTRRVKEQFNP